MANPEWNRSLGEPGDLADVIVAVFSLARTDHEVVKVSRHDLYDIFWSLQQEFPSLLPKMVFTRTGDYLYSKTLSVALEHALRLGVDPLTPRFCYFGIRDSTDAQRNLQLLRERAGEGFIEKMKPMADRFAGIVNSVPVRGMTPLEQGAKAFSDGEPLINNPYLRYTHDWDLWNEGWRDEWWRTATWRPR